MKRTDLITESRASSRWEDFDYIDYEDENGNHHTIDMGKLLDDQTRAETALVHLQPFFGDVVAKLQPVWTFEIYQGGRVVSLDTQATDGYHLFMNPWFTYNLTTEEKVFLLAHECMHCVLNHLRRAQKAGHTDGMRSNIAADYEVNTTLCYELEIVSASVLDKLHGYYKKEYTGLGYESIYDKCGSGGKGSPSQDINKRGDGVKDERDQKSQGKSGQGNGSNGSQSPDAQDPDYVAGWKKAWEDYNKGKLKL